MTDGSVRLIEIKGIEGSRIGGQRMSGIEVQRFSMRARMDTGLMIIELKKYNSAEELLIGHKNMRLWDW